MDRRTTRQAMGVFVVTFALGLPWALQVGQWLAGWPETGPAHRPGPASTAVPEAAGDPRPAGPSRGPDAGAQPVRRGGSEPGAARPPRAAVTTDPVGGRPDPKPTGRPESTVVPPGLTDPPTVEPTAPPTGTPPTGGPTNPASDGPASSDQP